MAQLSNDRYSTFTILEVEREMRKEILTPTVNINEMEICSTYLSLSALGSFMIFRQGGDVFKESP